MTEKFAMDKSRLNFSENKKRRLEKKKGKKEAKKLKQLKKKRLIVRNLSFKVSEEALKKIFSRFGEVLDVKIPVNGAGKKRGFGFVQFKNSTAQAKALKELNFRKIDGRPIAIDYAVDKTTYQSSRNNSVHTERFEKEDSRLKEEKLDADLEESDDIKPEIKLEKDSDSSVADESDEGEDAKVKKFLKEFDADNEVPENSDNEESAESSEDTDDENESLNSKEHSTDEDDEEDNDKSVTKPFKKRQTQDISEGKTIFIRNISFKNTEEDLKEIAEDYGEIVYCLFCMDSITDHFKGTAFVKFKEKESADKMIEESSKDPGIVLDGRRLLCSFALSREELSKMHDGPEKAKDKRNLKLLKCGLIMHGSEESEGVSQTDMAKRAQLEAVKKQKLRNVNFFVSDKRLVCHNLPKKITDKELFALFKKAAGEGAVVKEARVMRDMTKTDAQGIPVSRGFGFVAFSEHEHALKALTELNNDPKIFTPNKRPIVEFSVENKVALLSQERKREKMKMRHKKKLEEKNNKNASQMENEKNEEQTYKPIGQKKKKQKSQNKRKQIDANSHSTDEAVPKKKQKKEQKSQDKRKQIDANSHSTDAAVPKKKQKKHPRGRRNRSQSNQNRADISLLTMKYKEKLLNKLS